ncbi:MAG: hypothetical protein A2086_08030 [Spirochaetes bacterium GWD1_27_9]|nr:MAG: hypothetical protein A2Z98_07160 [Spirochaetes bacterium GWB1_27_13]OHD25152.1 MAG: hypothetical protein A2Y34_16830 [Spirochaetes bacterium GWC1_27_15]OHD34470.1 MAG: hypothetical protein A2086_08030 [Spirochaetes bacterium GWD1_27_9]
MEIQLPNFIDLTYDMVFVIDKGGSIKFANSSAEENLFYSKEEFLRMNLNEILFESEKVIEILDKIITSVDEKEGSGKFQNKQIDLSIIKREIGYQDLILISKDTKLKIIIANFQARRLIIDSLEYILLILRDITDRKYLEQELFKHTENLEMIVQEKTIELQKKNEMLERLATTDTLTNLMNIRRFREVLKFEIEKANKLKNDEDYETFVLVMLDADHFKYYNDTFGHQVGDEVIKGIGKILATSVRKIDTVARYGGDEFIILLTETNYVSSIKTCLRITDMIKNELKIKKIIKDVLNMENVDIPKENKISLSIGMSKYKFNKTMDEIINEADTGLYRSKEAGRDCIHLLYKEEYKMITEEKFNPADFK